MGWQVSAEARQIILRLVARAALPGECILVFLPGMMEIADMQDELERLNSCRTQLQVDTSENYIIYCYYARAITSN